MALFNDFHEGRLPLFSLNFGELGERRSSGSPSQTLTTSDPANGGPKVRPSSAVLLR
jgi:hypothetical protein